MNENEKEEILSEDIRLPKFLIEKIEEVSEKKKLTKKEQEKFIEKVKEEYLKGKYEPGEAVGIISAQSISEPATQMTMRTYHFAASAGVKVTHGLPRLIEIFDAKKEPSIPTMNVYLKSKYNNLKTAKKVAEMIIEETVVDVSENIALNLSDMSVDITLEDDRRLSAVKKAIIADKRFMRYAGKVKESGNKIVILGKEDSDIKSLQRIRSKITDVHVSGLEDVSNTVIRREGDDWIISTVGSTLESVLKIKEVDSRRTYSNDLHETKRILGVEAARSLIIREAVDTMQQQALNVDIRHLTLLSDMMTFSGDVEAIGRYGVAGSKNSILARAGFEETKKHLVRASIRGEVDNFDGIFENIMLGQVIPSGTGMFELIAKFQDDE